MNMRQHSFLITLLFIAVFTVASWADRIVPLSLTEITTSAATVFEGECTDIRSGIDDESGLISTWYTFKVIEPIKGKLSKSYTLKQYGGADGERKVVSPSAQYEIGQKVILFLYGASKIGFSSAVGLTQGKFNIEVHPETKKPMVSNGMPAAVLFKNSPTIPASYDKQGRRLQGARLLQAKQLDHDDFLTAVNEIIKSASKNVEKE